MSFFKQSTSIITILMIVACSESTETKNEIPVTSNNKQFEQTDSKKQKPINENKGIANFYQKPGASVQFTHNYDGSMTLGEAEPVTFTFNHGYNAGTISIQLEAQDGLDIADNRSPYTFTLNNPKTLEIETLLTAQTEGKYYLSIFATVDDLNGNSISRVFALAVTVGELGKTAKSSLEPIHMSLESRTSDEQIILMPAEETISQ